MIYKAKDPVYVTGDLHGNFHWLKQAIEKYDLRECTIIVCGDVGLGFSKLTAWMKYIKEELKLVKLLKERKIVLYLFRGNHDNPFWFDGKTVSLSVIRAVEDYSVVSTQTHNILCIGGGISPDRTMRKHEINTALNTYLKYHPKLTVEEAKEKVNLHYWPEERPVYDSKAIDALTCQIDVVCSHVAPFEFPPHTSVPARYLEKDPQLKRDCAEERNVFSKILRKLIKNGHPLSQWYYGHYHRYDVSEYRGIKTVLLDMARDRNLCIKALDHAAY